MKRKKFLTALVFFVVMLIVMRIQGASLITPASSTGIIDLEFAWTVTVFNSIMSRLDSTDVLINIFLDFAFIAAYWLFLIAAFDKLRSKVSAGHGFRKTYYGLITAAALLDVIENISMLVCVLAEPVDLLLKLTYIAAAIKFLAVAIAIIWLVVMMVNALVRSRALLI